MPLAPSTFFSARQRLLEGQGVPSAPTFGESYRGERKKSYRMTFSFVAPEPAEYQQQ
jgi:hypothetical protein